MYERTNIDRGHFVNTIIKECPDHTRMHMKKKSHTEDDAAAPSSQRI